MKFSKYIFFVLAAVFAACSSYEDERTAPERKLSKEEMIRVMVEIHLAESVISNSGLNNETGLYRFERYRRRIYSDYNIDSAVFAQNFEYISIKQQYF